MFCRPSRMFGGAVTFPVWDGEKLVGFSESGGNFEHRCAPGEHFFVASAQTYKGMPATLAGGSVYYVWLTPRLGFLSAGVGLTPVRAEDVELLAQVRTSLQENEYRCLLREKSDPYEANRRDTIREVLAEFRSGERTAEPALRAADGHQDGSTPPRP